MVTPLLDFLKHDITSSFSDLWYRVAQSRPRLASHARITPQSFGESRVYVVEDPASGGFYRLSEYAYAFIGMLDGRCTVDDAWRACCTQLGDDAPTQRECIDLLSKLQYFGLISGDQPLAHDMLERRFREANKRQRSRRWGGGLSITVPLINPDRFLDRIAYLLKPVFSRAGLAVYLITVAVALWSLLMNSSSLADQFNGALDPTNLGWLAVVFFVLRAWHEFGHAAACKAMGGRCTEIGMMLMAFLVPFPYCDTSSAWRFTELHKRVIVSAGGMLLETFLAAIAAIVWSQLSTDAVMLRSLLFNVMLISGVTTIVFNANPLLRYDGYYILSDVAGIANLAQRALELSRFLLLRKVFGISTANPPPISSVREFWLLLVYWACSTPYRLLITAGIVIMLWNDKRYLTLGSVIAVVAASMWLVWPCLKGISYLVTSPALLGRRSRAVSISVAAIASVALFVGLIPLPAPTYSMGTLEPQAAAPVRPQQDGFVDQLLVAEGQSVHAGDPLIVLRNGDVMAELAKAKADLDRANAVSDGASGKPGVEQSIAQIRLGQAEDALERAQTKADSLVLRAGTDGKVIPPPESGTRLVDLSGRFIQRGTLLALIATTDQMVVRCLVSDRDQAYIFGDRPFQQMNASFRVRGNAGDVTQGRITRAAPTASTQVQQASLTTAAGGDLALDPRDPEHHTSVNPQFMVELTPVSQQPVWQAGLRARVRFETPAQPLAISLWRKLNQYLGEKAKA